MGPPRARHALRWRRGPKRQNPRGEGFEFKWVPLQSAEGNKLFIAKSIRNWKALLPNPKSAPLGARLRVLRKRQNLTLFELARLTGVSHNLISRIERGAAASPDPAYLGRLIAFFGPEVHAGCGDLFDQAVPVTDFASWLRNFRMRRGLLQIELAKMLGVNRVTVWSYENRGMKPRPVVLNRLKRRFELNGEIDRFLK